MNQKLVAKVILALVGCFALAGPFWPRITLSLECIAVGLALVLTSSIWRVSTLVKVAGYLVWLAGLVLALIRPAR
jgi:hypothetical protein